MSHQKPWMPTSGRTERLLATRLRKVIALDSEASALTFKDLTFPWSYYEDAIAGLERVLEEHPEAARIGVVIRNRPGPLAALVAALATGREVIVLSPHLGDAGLAEDIVALAPDVVIADEEDWVRESVVEAARSVSAIAARSGSERAVTPHPVPWQPSPSLRPTNGIAVLMMTSGTTGKPKRVELTYDQLTAAFKASGAFWDDEHPARLRSGTAILWASMAHISGLYFAIAHVAEGRTIALLEKFEVQSWAELIRQHRPGYVGLPPTAMRMVLNADLPADIFSSLRAVGSGTAPLPPELGEEFEGKYGVPVLVTYGATEFAGAIAGWSLKDKKAWGARKRGSVGRAHRGLELRVVDRETNEVLPAGAVGLLEARGGQLPTTDGGWLRTTDLASIDEDGFLFIHGRADDAINRGGFKIPPSVLEDVLAEHPAVSDSCCIGVPDERLGQVPVVAVTLSGEATEDELMEFLSARLTRYQRPVQLRIVTELPRTPSMKISRPLVREQFFTEVSS